MRCCFSYALSFFGKVRISHMPLFVSVEPASVCQLRCPACPVGARNRDFPAQREGEQLPFINLDTWHRVLEEIRPYAHTVQFYFQGEPLLNKELNVMVYEACRDGLYTIVSTNAQAMTEELAEDLVGAGLHRIIVCVDGLSEESYNAYRTGGSLEQCKRALGYLREAKRWLGSHMVIELQVLRLSTNEHEWRQFRREYKALGADRLVFKTAQLYDYAEGHPLMPSDERYSRYTKGADGRYHRKKRSRGCFRVWSGAVVTTTGEVLPCCYDKAHAYAYGNIMNTRMRELFAGEKARAFRLAALEEQPDICKECWR